MLERGMMKSRTSCQRADRAVDREVLPRIGRFIRGHCTRPKPVSRERAGDVIFELGFTRVNLNLFGFFWFR
jgi:hypothetical protein